jgi:hypothetical protein
MAIGCMASPFVGMVADCYFESPKVLAMLNLLKCGIPVICRIH